MYSLRRRVQEAPGPLDAGGPAFFQRRGLCAAIRAGSVVVQLGLGGARYGGLVGGAEKALQDGGEVDGGAAARLGGWGTRRRA